MLLFRDRQFAAASATTFFFGAALFGGMFLLPLYYQVVRGQSALTAGLLMAPQGIGAALVMPLAGKLTDRYGSGRIVPVGLVVVTLATLVYTQLGAHTSFAVLAVSLFIRGIGFGFVMMPAISAAYQTLAAPQVPRASTAINIVQRVGGSIGTALVAVVLEHQIRVQVHGLTGGLTGRHRGTAVGGGQGGPAARLGVREHLLVGGRHDAGGPDPRPAAGAGPGAGAGARARSDRLRAGHCTDGALPE